jgi:L-ribulose-5-phosphate 3-epimerase
MRLGYNTNGLAHHSLPAAIDLLAGLGYKSVAITIDHAALNPYCKSLEHCVHQTQTSLNAHGMKSVIETGCRYLLDPQHKHEPTLVSKDASKRIDFLRHAIDIAFSIESDCVSLWAGRLPEGTNRQEGFNRLAENLQTVLNHAALEQVTIAFEPEPGMLIDTMASFEELLKLVDSPLLRLTLDVGHLHCLGETPIAPVIHQWKDRIANIHIEDMRAGVHEHLMFGEGEIDFPPIVAAFAEVGYDGPIHVELSRHSHVGPDIAKRSYDYLNPLIQEAICACQNT